MKNLLLFSIFALISSEAIAASTIISHYEIKNVKIDIGTVDENSRPGNASGLFCGQVVDSSGKVLGMEVDLSMNGIWFGKIPTLASYETFSLETNDLSICDKLATQVQELKNTPSSYASGERRKITASSISSTVSLSEDELTELVQIQMSNGIVLSSSRTIKRGQ
jgi:hypothetical protein